VAVTGPERLRAAQVVDAVVAAALFSLAAWEVLHGPVAEDVVNGPTWLNLVAVALMTLPVAFRNRAPLAAAVVVFTALAGRALLAEPLELYPPMLAAIIVTYTVAVTGTVRRTAAVLALAAAAVVVAWLRGSGGDATPEPLPSLVLLGIVATVGSVVGARDERARGMEERAAAREEQARAAVAAERESIAHELHDSVAHSLAMIALQAGGAQDVLDTDPARVRDALASMERAAREGLVEMRRLLSLTGEDEDAALAPQPGLDRLDGLVDEARRAGLDVALEETGQRRSLPPSVDLAAFRVVQESLTNAAKHVGRCRATIALQWQPGTLQVEVTNDGTAVPGGEGAGRGLVGMRERIRLVGGRLETGPTAAGFRVAAWFPLEVQA
jgi:signal transduction histidine kinase